MRRVMQWLRRAFCGHDWQPTGAPMRYVSVLTIFPGFRAPGILRTFYRCQRCGAVMARDEAEANEP